MRLYKTTNKQNFRNLTISAFLLSIFFGLTSAYTANAADYVFPVIGQSTFSNDFDAPRSNGPHRATDIIASKGQKIVSRTDGVVTFVANPQPSWGFAVFVEAANGYEYWYLHINNDTPGTDDGRANPYYAYGPDIERGKRVVKGQLLGYVGDSGNSEETVSHLHLEVVKPNDSRVNAYSGLVNNSYKIGTPVQSYPLSSNEIIPTSTSFKGGYSIDLGDVDGDGTDEIIVGSKKGGKQVMVLRKNKTLIGKFEPNGSKFFGGVDVATGDVDGDGVDEIVTGAGPGGKQVKVFRLNGQLIGKFEPYGSKIGVSVGVGNFDNDAADEIITGARKGGGPRVNIYNLDGSIISSHYVYNESFKGGIRVDSGELNRSNAHDEVVTISQQDGTARTKVTSTTGRSLATSRYFAEDWWQGYYDVAVSDDGQSYGSLGINRRSSIRTINY